MLKNIIKKLCLVEKIKKRVGSQRKKIKPPKKERVQKRNPLKREF
ncbi:hypothetical protein HMPREF1422_00939 [Helicobacter pylori GAM268Bii]|nr:hypothetical protein HMPREF1419_01074 [Helicobacter pylori GAM263BFi]EMH29503.1 hypothetical protein HMPREF1422_00939 [Helicobacter pylori GAM268Bii]